MKKSRANSRRRASPAAKAPPAAPDGEEERSPVRQPSPRRRLWIWIVLLLVMLLWVYTSRERLREKWLEAQSVESLRELEANNTADTRVHLLYARRLLEAGALDDAVSPLDHAVASLSPATAPDLARQVYALAGYVAARRGDNRRAEEWLQHAAGTRSDDVFLFLGKGLLALHRQHALEAVQMFTAATQLDPASAEAWSSLGAAFMLGAEPERAVDPYRRAVTLAPQDPQKHVDLAQALGGAHRYAEAEAEFQAAANLAPLNPAFIALPAVGQANSARTDAEYQQAASLLRAALATRPEDARLHAVLAGLYIRFGQYAGARQELEASLARSPGNPDGWYNLAMTYERLGDRQGAAAANARFQQQADLLIDSANLKQQALLHSDDPNLFLRLADVLRRQRKNQEAYGALIQAARLKPKDPQIAQALHSLQATLPPTTTSPIPTEGAEQK